MSELSPLSEVKRTYMCSERVFRLSGPATDIGNALAEPKFMPEVMRDGV